MLLAASPASGTPIGPSTSLVLRFDRSLDSKSLALHGSLAASASAAWSATAADNDTLTLRATAGWPSGTGSLLVDVQSEEKIAALTTSLTYAVDGIVPTAAATPVSGTTLAPTTAITVRFSKSMQITTLSLSGDLATSAAAHWSATVNADDTVNLTPLTLWNSGAHTLQVDARDEVGTAIATLLLHYDIALPTDAPTASLSPPDATLLNGHTAIVVSFSEAMQTESLMLGGSLASEGALALWSAAGDQLTLLPSSARSAGAMTLSLDATDTNGNPLATLLASFTVDTTPPIATLIAPIPLDDPRATVIISFSESVARSSLALGGTLFDPSIAATWNASDDTLTLSPPPWGWSNGDLNVAAADLAGNVSPRLTIAASVTDWPIIDLPMHGVQVTDDDPTSHATPMTGVQAQAWLWEADRVYAHAGIHFVFDPIADFSTAHSTLANQMGGTGDAQWATEVVAANAIADAFADHGVVLFRWGPDPSGPTGGAFSWTSFDFVAGCAFDYTGVCGHQNITLLAHELGHYLGLAHTFPTVYNTVGDAQAALVAASGDTTIFDGDGLVDTSPDPFSGDLQCALDTYDETLDGLPLALPRDNIMSYDDAHAKGFSPSQMLRVRQGALMRSGQDIRGLLAGSFEPAVEGEAVVAGASVSGGSFAEQDMSSFLGKWSGGAQLWWSGPAAIGGSLSFSFNSASGGVHRVFVTLTQAPDFGIQQFYVNDQIAGDPVDLYSSTVGLLVAVDLGEQALIAGSNTVSVKTAGKNPLSGGYGFGLDYMLLRQDQ